MLLEPMEVNFWELKSMQTDYGIVYHHLARVTASHPSDRLETGVSLTGTGYDDNTKLLSHLADPC